MHFSSILYILGWLVTAFGVSMIFPVWAALHFNDGDWMVFVGTGGVTVFLGVNLVLMNRRNEIVLSHRDGFLLTLLSWTVLSAIGSIPFYLAGVTATWADAFFESVSGLTTTGATVLVGLDTMGHGILLWRHILQWLGGMGIIVLAIAVLPFLGVGGMQLFRTEMPGVVKDKLQPRLSETARMLWIVYLGFTVIWIVLYWLAGMTAFDAICHAFSTIAIGGFSTHDASFAYFDSVLIELICIVGMIVGTLSFALHYICLTRRDPRLYWKNEEFRFYMGVLVIACMTVFLALLFTSDYSFGQALRYGVFNTVSIATTTGFATTDYSLWHAVVPMVMLMVMFMGGCSGSTGGGMKILRIMLVVKQGMRELFRLVHPHSVSHIKVGRQMVPDHIMQALWSFVGLYVIVFNAVALVLTLYGIDLVTAFSAAAATITNTGPGLGDVGPSSNYAGLPGGAKLVLCLSMLVGRLEIFTLLVILTPAFWKK
jgi:trk system potassium uptake protein TrkH